VVEIIRKGQLPSEKVYEASCGHCHTRFRFKQGEADYNSDPRDGDYLSIRCPLDGCGHLVTMGLTRQHVSTDYWDR